MPDEIKELEKFASTLEPIKKKMSSYTVPSLALSAVELGGNFVIQNRHAFIAEEEYRKGESPGFRDEFKPLYPRLPEVKTPTKTAVMYLEDGIFNSVTLPTHGLAVASTGSAAWEAMTGDPHLPGIAFNRMPYEDTIGKQRKPLLGPIIPEKFKVDLALPVMRAWMKGASYQVISTSTSHHNEQLTSRTERISGEKQIDECFGHDAVFVQSIGNYRDMEAGLRHCAYSYHPSTLLVGACQSLPVSYGDDTHKKDFRVQHLEAYSSFAPDIVWETNPTNAKYIASLTPGETQYLVMDGTSFAAPQAATVVAAMLRRYARSPENPEAVLSKEDILLALRQTAQPVHVREFVSSHTTSINSCGLLPLYRVGNNYISEEAGCGSIDVEAVWKHLEIMEQGVKEGKCKSLARQTIQAEIPTPIVTADAKGHYYYPIEIDNPLVTDSIVIDVKSRGLTGNAGQSSNKLYLASSNGELLQLMPSINSANHFLITKSSGFHGVPLAGKWTLVSTAPVEQAHISFVNAMAPEHVNVAIQPSEPKRFRNLYHRADLRTVKAVDLDERLMKRNDSGIPFIAQHDFSSTSFPENYLELRLMQLASDPNEKSHAIALVNSNYAPFEAHRNALLTALEKQDTQSILQLLAPSDKAKANVLEYALDEREKPAIVTMLLENGFAKRKNNIGTPFIVRLVQETERDGVRNQERVVVLKAAIDTLHKQGVSIMQKDARGKTVLDFALGAQTRPIIAEALTEEDKRNDLKFSALSYQLPQTSTELLQALPTKEQIEKTIHSFGKKLNIDVNVDIESVSGHIPFGSFPPKHKSNKR